MGFEQAAIGVCMACVVTSLISIVFFIVAGAALSVKTVADARRQARRASPYLGQLSRWCSVSELAGIDRALDQTLAEDRAAHLGLPGR